jgi:hypothetical protein
VQSTATLFLVLCPDSLGCSYIAITNPSYA